MNWTLDFAVRATILLAFGLGLRWVVGQSSAEKRVTILRATLAALVALPLAMLFLPSTRIPVLKPTAIASPVQTSGIIDETPVQHVSAGANTPDHRDSFVPTETKFAPPASITVRKPFSWRALAINLWLGIASLLLLTTFLRLVQVASIRRRSQVSTSSTTNLCKSAMNRLGVRSRVVCRYAKVGSPLTFGMLRHTILLPHDFETWSEVDREAVMLHEAAHIRRFDCAWQWLSAALRAVYWCHPLVWSASRALRDDSELAADERAVRSGISATDYAASLIAIARNIQQQRVLVQPQGVTFMHQDQLERRVHNILHPRQRGFSSLGLLALCGAVLGAGALVGTVHFTVAKPHAKEDVGMTIGNYRPPEVDIQSRTDSLPPEVAGDSKVAIATDALPRESAEIWSGREMPIAYQDSRVDYEALFSSITAAQKRLLKSRGYLFVSDLSARQRSIVGTLPGRDFTLQMTYRSQLLKIKPDPINNNIKYFVWDSLKKKYVAVSSSQVERTSGVMHFAWDPKQKVYVPVTSTRNNPYAETAFAPVAVDSMPSPTARAGGRHTDSIPRSTDPFVGRAAAGGRADVAPLPPTSTSAGGRADVAPGAPVRATTGSRAGTATVATDVTTPEPVRSTGEGVASAGAPGVKVHDSVSAGPTAPSSKGVGVQAGGAASALPAGVTSAGPVTTIAGQAPAATGSASAGGGVTIHSSSPDSGVSYTAIIDKGVLTLRDSKGHVKRWKVPNGVSVMLNDSGKIKVLDKDGKPYDLSKHEIK